MKDFTHTAYRKLINLLRNNGYTFYRFKDYAEGGHLDDPHVILRHDVDRLPGRALKMASLEADLGAVGTYFFRAKSVSFNIEIISRILELGHEVGYHYEELADIKGNLHLAWQLFRKNIKKFDGFGGVRTIAMHGRPFSKWNSMDLWDTYDYGELGPIMDAVQDIPWDKYAYFSDTGRDWSGRNSKRDKPCMKAENIGIACTMDMIRLVLSRRERLILSAHPERWTNNSLGWLQVLATDYIVNALKRIS